MEEGMKERKERRKPEPGFATIITDKDLFYFGGG